MKEKLIEHEINIIVPKLRVRHSLSAFDKTVWLKHGWAINTNVASLFLSFSSLKPGSDIHQHN